MVIGLIIPILLVASPKFRKTPSWGSQLPSSYLVDEEAIKKIWELWIDRLRDKSKRLFDNMETSSTASACYIVIVHLIDFFG